MEHIEFSELPYSQGTAEPPLTDIELTVDCGDGYGGDTQNYQSVDPDAVYRERLGQDYYLGDDDPLEENPGNTAWSHTWDSDAASREIFGQDYYLGT